MRHLTTLIMILTLSIFLIHGIARSQVFIGETEVDTATVATGLDIPWEIQWGPDDHLWVTERFGRVSRIDPGSGSQDVILDISDIVEQTGESGLLGMALHPDFSDTARVFLVYTYLDAGQIRERVVSYDYDGTSLVDEHILLGDIPGSYNHDGSRIIITPDYKLIVTTGDALDLTAPQDPGHLSGKVLRLNIDGTIPADNPFPGNPVWTIGHRNPQGLLLAPNGILYSSEHGPDTDDELNIIEKGRNYGWPEVKGYCDQPDELDFCQENNVKEPIAAWTPTIATSDIIYYDHPAIPEWQGSILLTTLKNKRIYELELDATGTEVISESQFFSGWWGRLRDICTGPDGEIYLATNGDSWSNTDPFTHRIIRISNPVYLSTGEHPGIPVRELKITPNPFSIHARVESGKDLTGSEYRLISAGGQLVRSGVILSDDWDLGRDGLHKGLYYLQVLSGTVHYGTKVIIH